MPGLVYFDAADDFEQVRALVRETCALLDGKERGIPRCTEHAAQRRAGTRAAKTRGSLRPSLSLSLSLSRRFAVRTIETEVGFVDGLRALVEEAAPAPFGQYSNHR